jgi:PucR family transcriptional regulator, purine catabolism regulatory protein
MAMKRKGAALLKLLDALALDTLKRAKIVAGAGALERTLSWVHVVDVPDPLPWVREGHFLLTTGYAWPRDESAQYRLISELAHRGLAGLGLAVPNFFEQMPKAARQAADDHDFPLLEIPWDIPFSSITEQIHQFILSFQRELLERSEAIHRKLMKAALEAESLQDISDSLSSLIGRDVAIEHPEGGVLAYSEQGRPAAVRAVSSVLHLGQQTGPDRPDAFHLPEMPELGLPARFVCPIHLKRELTGIVWITETSGPLGELEQRAAEYAAVVISLHLSQQRALASLERQLGYSFLESLQEGKFELTTQMVNRAQILGFDPEGVYFVGLLLIRAQVPLSRDGIIRREKLTERLRAELQALDVPPLLSISQNQVTFLIPERCDSVHSLWSRLQAKDVTLFISRKHKGFEGVSQGYAEVCSMIPYAAAGEAARFEDLLVHRVLTGEQEARLQFMAKLFAPLKTGKNGEVLVETLIAAARSGFQLKKTAEELCIHPKTLRYRLDRAIALGGLDLDNPDTRFELQLAARILSLEAKEGS